MLGNLCADTICSEKQTVFRSEPFFCSEGQIIRAYYWDRWRLLCHYNSNLPKTNRQYSSFGWTRAGALEPRLRPEYEIRAVNLFMVVFIQLTKYKLSLGPKKTTKRKKKKKKDKKTTKRQRYTGQRLVHLAFWIQLNSSTFILPQLKDMEDKSGWTVTFDD